MSALVRAGFDDQEFFGGYRRCTSSGGGNPVSLPRCQFHWEFNHPIRELPRKQFPKN